MTLPSLPSASKLELAEHCVYPWSSGVRWPKREPMSADQRYGLAFHDLAAAMAAGSADIPAIITARQLTGAEEKRLEATADHLAEVLLLDQAAATPEAEVAYVYDVDTGAIERAADRWAGGPGRVYGAADLVFERQDGVYVVRDWKTGHRARGRSPGQTPQLRFLGMVAGALAGFSTVRVELAFVDEEGVEVVGEQLDALDLGAVEGELAGLVDRIKEPPTPRPGPWCERYYCPLRASCPATLAALAHVDGELQRFPLLGAFQSAEHAAFVRHRLPVLQALLDERQADIEEYSKHYGPLPVEDKPGMVWGPREQPGRERIEASPAALKILRSKLSAEGAEVAIEKSISKASIERGVKRDVTAAGGKRGAATKMLTPLLEELRAAKAVKKGAPFMRFEEFKRAGGDEPSTHEGEEG